ncbi:hypothetical protein V5E97_07625 [Singulisphaera sp. Ch08]|uniref:Uncharacterized protein n=1 Tax=Singulisphaera sp. Ch08 TaxID=3120278 RepID=A0AAU7CKV7_9BACT
MIGTTRFLATTGALEFEGSRDRQGNFHYQDEREAREKQVNVFSNDFTDKTRPPVSHD